MNKKFIQSVGRSMDILEYLASNPNARLQEISESLELNKSTLHSLISTLEQLGYVEKNIHSPRYSLGVKLYQLGKVYEKEFQIREKFKPILDELQAFSGETSYFTLRVGKKYIYIDKSETERNIKVDPSLGKEEDINLASAIGKIYKSYEDKNELEYATDFEEVEEGMNCIAFPLVKDNNLIGVIGLGGPSNRLTKDKMEKINLKWKEILNNGRV